MQHAAPMQVKTQTLSSKSSMLPLTFKSDIDHYE